MPEHTANRGTLTGAQGQLLVRLARLTIAARLRQAGAEQELAALTGGLAESVFTESRASFVTLKTKTGELRGCIGSLAALESLRDNVRHNAINAAFEDPRFVPLTADELETVEIEVSVLSAPSPLVFQDTGELLARLRPHVDGVILRKGLAGATFLPQVWEQLPRTEDFLAHLSRKAGLAPDAWTAPGIRVETYQVQYFKEHS